MSPSNEPASNPRLPRLTKLLNNVLYGKPPLAPANGPLFLEAICAQPDVAACINKLISSNVGLQSLQKAMWFDLSISFLNGAAADFVAYIQAPELQAIGGGAFLQQVITAMVYPPILWNVMSNAFRDSALSEKGELAFSWLLLQLISLPADEAAAYRELALDPKISDRLFSSSFQSTKNLGQRIKAVLSTVDTAQVAGDYAPGGRHDNDFADFRDISILPTADEIMSTELAFLRQSSTLDDPDTEANRVAIHLDNQFRLLREDMLYEMREELHIALGKKKGKHRGNVLEGLVLTGLHCGVPTKRCRWSLTFDITREPWQFKGKLNKLADRKAYLSQNYRFLQHQSLACLIVDDEVVAFPTIHRDEDLLSRTPSVITLQIQGEASTTRTLSKLKTAQQTKLIQINTPIFSYEPILRALQVVTTLPLSSELLCWKAGNSVVLDTSSSRLAQIVNVLRENHRIDLCQLLSIQKSTPIQLDSSQTESLISGLTQSVSLIQGPPGTGKSFIGALLAKCLHDTTVDTILVVCFTNHALDQFLEDLLDIGIPQANMVRLGSKSTPRTEPFMLQKQNSKFKFSRGDWTEIDRQKASSETLVQRLSDIFQKIQRPHLPLPELMEHLEFEHIEYFEAFRVPGSDDGMIRTDRKGREVNSLYLINQWVRGWDAGIFKNEPSIWSAAGIWAMNRPSRVAKLEEWRLELLAGEVAEFHSAAKQYNDCQDRLAKQYGQKTAEILRTKRIIGCTTTAAAKYSADIQAALPGVLLVEEAGEILESHVLTALGAGTKKLILIGDHKQLRPKVNNYLLTVEKDEGYDLNRSLFERLVLKGYPHATLNEQHRMRPEISALIRSLTYPGLVDAQNTQNRPNLRGVQDNIVFIDHASPEDDLPQTSERRDPNTLSSKQNTHEADMVLKILRYLAQQGYGSDKVVILTPYLGQLHKFQEILKDDHDPVLNDLDSFDLVRAGLIPAATAKLSKKPIRLATIDNYQGEESDIVLVSLVRSNSTNDIGFMFAPERLNVLLSRARNALIMIGNSHTYLNARKGKELWGRLFDLLKNDKHVYDGLPVQCERHPKRTALLRKPIDFDEKVPDGGCQEPCGAVLNCTLHACPSKCHQLYDHSKMTCEFIVEDRCSNGHALKWQCHSGRPASCRKCERDAKIAADKQQKAFEAQQKKDDDEAEHSRQLAKLDEQIAAQRQATRDSQLAEERAVALEQKQRDLKEATSLASRASNAVGAAIQAMLNSTSAASAPPTATAATTPSNSSPPAPAAAQPATTPAGSSPMVAQLAPMNTSISPPTSPSASDLEWERQKLMEGASNESIDAIMAMTGLEAVKAQVLNIKAKIDTTQRQGTSLKDERFNIVLLGNPGTGKTTVARHYAKFLSSLNVLPGSAFVETTGSRLANDGTPGIKKHIEEVKNAGGGAIFVDEAYQLTSAHNFQGSQVLDFLLAEMENNVGFIVFILAGYNKQMEKFFEHNPGLTSRVPYSLQFSDYSDDQLLLMMERRINKKYNGRMKVEDGVQGLYSRIAIRRLARGRGREGFGNARALENVLAKISERQAARLNRERQKGLRADDFLFSKEDLIGPEPSAALIESTSWKRLQALIGLNSVKESIRSLFDLIDTNYKRELVEKTPVQISLNRVFLGSPGTGKTSVAKLYGQILADLGLLSNGEVMLKNPADFTGSVLGESEKNTKAILAASVGKVLIIDEAYMLYGGSGGSGIGNQADMYKTAVIDTIVAEVQSTPGEDRCVLLLGYKDQMEEMFQNVNPGLARRFAIEDAFHFEDFSDEDLLKILNLKLKDQDLAATDPAKQVAIELLSRGRNRPNFGNAGEVENLLGQAKTRYQARQRKLPPANRAHDIVFEPEDFDPEFDRDSHASVRLQELFKDVIGCEEIIAKLGEYQETARRLKARGLNARDQIPTTFVMKGPPGTGKTTTARKMGQVYYDMGFLSSGEVVECSASDLVGQYVGQTGPKTQKLLEKALGRVLFVDEAYRLGDGPFAKEAIDELVSLLTQPKFLHKIVVILAGYDEEMNQLMAINTGLSSRFSEVIYFKNMAPARCLEVLKKELSKKTVVLHELDDPLSPAYQELTALLEEMSRLPSWGNARDVGTLAKKMISHVFRNLLDDSDGSAELTLSGQDAVSCAAEMLAERRERSAVTRPSRSTPFLNMQQTLNPSLPPPPPSTRTSHATRAASPTRQAQPQSASGDARDAGVTEDVWQRLQADKAAAELQAQRAEEATRKLEREIQKAKEREEADRAEAKRLADLRLKDDEEERERRRKLEELRIRENLARAERERKAAELRARQEEEARQRQQEAQAQAKLRQMGVCVAGFRWIKQANGYRCAGGSHFVDNASLGM